MSPDNRRRRWILAGVAVVGGVLVGVGAYAMTTWRSVDRVTIDRPDGLAVHDAPSAEPELGPDDMAVPEFRLPPVPSSADGMDTFLMVGSDSRINLDDLEGFGEFEGARADVVLLVVRDRVTDQAAMVSLPRDLWVSLPCGGRNRINVALEGCGEMNGPTTLLVTVESLTGVGVDHFGVVDFAGFQEVVDELGGYEICVDRPVRDERAHLALPAGCHLADGAATLAWLRSRETQELTEEGSWVVMEGVSDLTRTERQRDFMVEMIERIGDFGRPQDALAAARSVAPLLTIDSELGLTQAVSLAWTMRGLGGDSIHQMTLPVEDYVTEQGAEVLVPVGDVEEVIAEFLVATTVEGSDEDVSAAQERAGLSSGS